MIANINQILRQVDDARESDFVFVLLCTAIKDKAEAYRVAYGRQCDDIDDYCKRKNIGELRSVMETFGFAESTQAVITRTENMKDMVDLLARINREVANGNLDIKDALNMEKDIRVKLQDKFEIQEEAKNQRLIIVPAKHDLICPHTNKECYKMPTKEACMKYYNLKENKK